jgi:hypothetical protein
MTIQTSIVYIMILLMAYSGFRLWHWPFYMPLLLTCMAMVIIIAIKLIIAHRLIPDFSIGNFIHRGILSAFYVIIPTIIPVMLIRFSLEGGSGRFILVILVSTLSMLVSTYYIGLSRQMRKRVLNMLLLKLKGI